MDERTDGGRMNGRRDRQRNGRTNDRRTDGGREMDVAVFTEPSGRLLKRRRHHRAAGVINQVHMKVAPKRRLSGPKLPPESSVLIRLLLLRSHTSQPSCPERIFHPPPLFLFYFYSGSPASTLRPPTQHIYCKTQSAQIMTNHRVAPPRPLFPLFPLCLPQYFINGTQQML